MALKNNFFWKLFDENQQISDSTSLVLCKQNCSEKFDVIKTRGGGGGVGTHVPKGYSLPNR